MAEPQRSPMETSSARVAAVSANSTKVRALRLGEAEFDELLTGSGDLWRKWNVLWSQLQPHERDFCSHPVWLAAWLRQWIKPDVDDVRLFVVEQDNRLLAAIPLEVVWVQGVLRRPACTLVAPADSPLEGGSLAVRESDRTAVLSALLECWLDPPSAGKKSPLGAKVRPLFVRFEQVDGTHHLRSESVLSVEIEPSRPRAVLSVPACRIELDSRLRTNLRKSLKRGKSKLAKSGTTSICEFRGEKLVEGLERLAQLEAKSWKGEVGTDLATDKAMHRFFRDVLQGLGDSGAAIVRVLQIEGRDIAAQLVLKFEDTLYVHKIAYDGDAAIFCPGNILLEETLTEFAHQNGIKAVNLVTYQPWNDNWNPELRSTYMVDLFPAGLRGSLAALGAVSMKSRLKRVLHRWNEAR